MYYLCLNLIIQSIFFCRMLPNSDHGFFQCFSKPNGHKIIDHDKYTMSHFSMELFQGVHGFYILSDQVIKNFLEMIY